jgi:hypothetical protein
MNLNVARGDQTATTRAVKRYFRKIATQSPMKIARAGPQTHRALVAHPALNAVLELPIAPKINVKGTSAEPEASAVRHDAALRRCDLRRPRCSSKLPAIVSK